MFQKERLPAVKHDRSDREPGAELFNCAEVCKILREDTENKEKAVSGIGNDGIRKDRVCMPAAFTDDTADCDTGIDRFPGNKVNEGAVIRSMGIAAAFRAAPGTDVRMTGIALHESSE